MPGYGGFDDDYNGEIRPGLVLGSRYKIIGDLGEGAMCAVYLALDLRLNEKVAVKIPHFRRTEEDPDYVKRLTREAQIAAKIKHANICKVSDVDSSHGCHYIVMQYVDGITLKDQMEKNARPLSPYDSARLTLSLAETIQAAHDLDIVHRDLKPANLMISSRGDLIVMDFGMAKEIKGLFDNVLCSDPGFKGTAAYASPEQFDPGFGELGPSSDIWALGVILYEISTGRRPFEGNQYAVWQQIINKDPVPPSTHNPAIDREFESIILKAIFKRPKDRYASMTEFARVLSDHLSQSGETKARSSDEAQTVFDPVLGPAPDWSGNLSAVTSTTSSDLGLYDSTEPFVEPDEAPALWEPEREFAPEFVSDRTRMRLIRVSAGNFLMGSTDGDSTEQPVHRVEIGRSFYLGRTPVTQSEYQQVRGAIHCHFRDDSNNPVENVNWFDAIEFCNELSARDGFPIYYRIIGQDVTVIDWRGPGYRLPTEAEWEYACRSARNSRFGFGDDEARLDRHAWSASNSLGKTHPVASKWANAWGFHDMHGNVREWCWDWFDPRAYSLGSVDPSGPAQTQKFRVNRGGHWQDEPAALRSSKRHWFQPMLRNRYIGFRVARTVL